MNQPEQNISTANPAPAEEPLKEMTTMKCNVGPIDRITRMLVGLGIIAAGAYFRSWWGAIGLVPLLTAALSWCPLYLPIGLSTCKTKATTS